MTQAGRRRSGLASLLRSWGRLRHGDPQPVVALVDGENEPITHTSQIDKAKPVGDKHRGVLHYSITQDEVVHSLLARLGVVGMPRRCRL